MHNQASQGFLHATKCIMPNIIEARQDGIGDSTMSHSMPHMENEAKMLA